ncbi:isoprenoid biosynthesis glyoxalase ElbB [Magnetovibrio sp.]|uniref:isoprenoid biosynthesis glyoxalase ElbB n=1 Tax=Magnetovibrio sp. TaxID=2024836 RepID=UPI002F948E81
MSNSANVAVVLSGCGVFDGAEIHESVFTLLALDRRGARYQCFAPDIDQAHVVNHLTHQIADGESRNVLVESARIARGAIKPLSQFNAQDFDALAFPGGFGAAKNLSTFAFDGADCTVDPDVERALKDMVAAGKPIAALCITPAVVAKVLKGADVTIGQDPGTAKAIEAMGAHHTPTEHKGVVIDPNYKLVTAPCYMLDSTISQIADGADAAMEVLLGMV